MAKKEQKLIIVLLLLAIGGGVILLRSKSKSSSSYSQPPSQEEPRGKQENNSPANSNFFGEKGVAFEAIDGKVYIDESEVSDGNLHAFNFYSEKEGKTIYFFIVKASDGTYRAAANACEVCFEAKTGFKQFGDEIRCENCRTMYSKDQIALQKGGCNPRPIDKDVEVVDGQLVMSVLDIEKAADLF